MNTPRREREAEAAVLLSDTVGAMRRSGIREMMDLADVAHDVLHLEIGEPDFPTPPNVIRAAAQAMQDGQVKYTVSRGIAPLREAIVAKLHERNSITASADEVVVTTGGTTAVFEALLVILRVGDGVLIPDPGWPSFDMIVTLLRGRVLRYGLRAEADYTPDLDEVERLARRARVLVINTPSNPTGAVFTRDTLEGLLGIAERHGLIVISDEVYEDIVFDGAHVSAASLGGEVPVISVFSFSKGFAMTGWRIGYFAAPAAIAEAVVKAQEAVVACPSSLAQHAALAALSGPRDCIDEMREGYRARRDLAVRRLETEGLLLTRPRGTFYVMADVARSGLDSYEFGRRLLVERGVAVAPGATFGDEARAAVRLSLASAPETIAEGIRRIGEAIREWEPDRTTDTAKR
jgi:aspartate/methionine/tyrosine aminotransferase